MISLDTLNALEPRSRYLATSEEIQGDRADGGRWMIINIWELDSSGVPANRAQEPTVFYTDFIFQETGKIDRERVQVFPSSGDSGKSYFFDREFRQFTFQGIVYDVQYDEEQQAQGLIAAGYSRFKLLYDICFRMSQAAKKNLILELDTDHFRMWGSMTSMTGTHATDSPTMYVITFSFWVEAMQVKGGFTAPDNLFLSREAAQKVDLIILEAKENAEVPRLAVVTPTTRVPKLRADVCGVETSLKQAQMVYSDATSAQKRVITPTRRAARRV